MKLERGLSAIHVFAISAGMMVSAGLFILPGLAHAQAGPAVVISYLVAGLLATTGMLSQAELSSAMPKAGGAYFYVTRSMGAGVGTVYGLVTWFSLCLKAAFALVGIGLFAALVTEFSSYYLILPLCALFVIINIRGVALAGSIQVYLVLGIILVLSVFIAMGLPQVNVRAFEPFTPHGIGQIFSTAGFVFICYGGLLNVASVAEEVKDPDRSLPLGMTLALILVGILYFLVILVTVGVMGTVALDDSTTPLSDAADRFMGKGGMIALSVCAIVACVTASNGAIMAASRYPLALARDQMLPEPFGRISNRFKTPHLAVLITGLMVGAMVFVKLEMLVKAASSILILTYIFTCLSNLILRESRLQNYQPSFRAPLYPWLKFVGLIGFGLMLVTMGTVALLVSGALIVAGMFVYWFYGRVRANREYAIMHLIERITAKELTSHSLETELKEIIRERDNIAMDRFDHIIEACPVLDIDQAVSMEAFFAQAARTMAPRISLEADDLLELLLKRERESTTVLSPFLAIPHIVVEGDGTFDVLLARCREGIAFPDAAKAVHTVFLLVGSADERTFHLQTLAAIAQIVQDPTFEERWMKARSEHALRDVVLLGKRPRHEPAPLRGGR